MFRFILSLFFICFFTSCSHINNNINVNNVNENAYFDYFNLKGMDIDTLTIYEKGIFINYSTTADFSIEKAREDVIKIRKYIFNLCNSKILREKIFKNNEISLRSISIAISYKSDLTNPEVGCDFFVNVHNSEIKYSFPFFGKERDISESYEKALRIVNN